MRELNIDDVEQVNGGDAVEGLALFGTAISLVALTGIGTLGVGTAFIAAPITAVAALGLAFAGGFNFVNSGRPNVGTVTVSSDFRDSDC